MVGSSCDVHGPSAAATCPASRSSLRLAAFTVGKTGGYASSLACTVDAAAGKKHPGHAACYLHVL